MTKRFGFTLAEVLITLGIIGVVAAMTIPTLIANTNGAKFRSQFKKTLSTLNQAGLMGQAQYEFDYAGTTEACANGAKDHPENVMTFCSLLNGTLTGTTYYDTVSDIKRGNSANEGGAVAYSLVSSVVLPEDATSYHAYSLADGSIVAFNSSAKGCTLDIGTPVSEMEKFDDCLGFIDVNGATLPNKEVTCSTGKTQSLKASSGEDGGGDDDTTCVVKNDAAHLTDVFPVVFHDATVEPASNAAKYVLTTAK